MILTGGVTASRLENAQWLAEVAARKQHQHHDALIVLQLSNKSLMLINHRQSTVSSAKKKEIKWGKK
jgi:hypothetical protein